ncbi:MAG: T9SS type A sorting domain-containing protein, partial [Ferruginibacter sp.]|nr:T9SS type A sorting domain-containing protein [Cytophagales bacterium]
MKTPFTFFLLVFLLESTDGLAQKRWDRGANSDSWDEAANWEPDGVPQQGDAVILDNTHRPGSYTVTLSDTSSHQITRLTVRPDNPAFPAPPAVVITLLIPASNTRLPNALWVGDLTDTVDVTIHHGGIIRNSSGATGGLPFQVTGPTVGGNRGSLQINNGGRYVHNTLADHFNGNGSDGLLDQLKQTPLGVSEGIFEFRAPTNGRYALSLGALNPGYVPNTLLLSRGTAAGNTTYVTTGPNFPVALKSNFVIGPDVTFSPSLTGQLQIDGNVTVDGTWRPERPTEAGSGVPSVNLNGNSPTTPQRVSGSGTIDFSGGNGANLVVSNSGGNALAGPGVVLSIDINLNQGALPGSGRFDLSSYGKFTTVGASRIFSAGGSARVSFFSTLTTEHPGGVAGCLAMGGPNVFDPRVHYVFRGNSVQNAGFPANLGNPTSVRIANATPPTGVTLNRSVALTIGDDTPPTLTVDTGAILTAGVFTVGGTGGGATFGANATLSTANAGGVQATLPDFTARNFSPANDNNFIFNGTTDQVVNGMPAVVRNLTIANVGGAVDLAGSTTVNGTLALNAGRLTIGSRTLTLNGTAVSNGGTLTGSGESDVVVGGRGALGTLAFTAGSQFLRSLTMDRADNGLARGSVALGSPLAIGNAVVGGTLALTTGLVTTSPANLLTLPALATVTGGSARSYVNGPVARITNAAAAYALPTGKDGIYAPVGLTTRTDVLTTYTAEYFKANATSAPAPCPCNTNAVDEPNLSRVTPVEYWTVVGSGGSAAKVTLPWGPHSGVASEGLLTVAFWNGRAWIDTYAEPEVSPGGVPNATGGTVTSPFVSAFGVFTLGDYAFNPLPVTLVSFTGWAQGSVARLAWTTASEANNAGFYVEKSPDARAFERIGFVAAGQSAGRNAYHFDDPQLARSSYYRLQQVDEDGRTAYSKTIFVAFRGNGPSGFVSPNPTEGEIDLRFPDPAQEVELSLFSASGALLRTFRDEAQWLQADLSGLLRQLPAGLYL